MSCVSVHSVGVPLQGTDIHALPPRPSAWATMKSALWAYRFL